MTSTQESRDAARSAVTRCRELQVSFGAAESLTGGLIGATITAIPGASSVFAGSIVAYSEEIKVRLLGVEPAAVAEHSVVSLAVAQQMATGAQRVLDVAATVAVTGVAGPGGQGQHPAGTVAIGWAIHEQHTAAMFSFAGDRDEVRVQTVESALLGLVSRLPSDS